MPVVNYVAVIAAALCGFLLGVLWYSRFLFGRRWERAGADDDGSQPVATGRPSILKILITFLFNLVCAYLLAAIFLPGEPLTTTTIAGAAVGLGVASSLAVNYPLTRQPTARLMIDGGFHIVRFALIGLVLGIVH